MRNVAYFPVQGQDSVWAILVPSKSDDDKYQSEFDGFEKIIKNKGLTRHHKNFKDYMQIDGEVGTVSEEMIDVLQQYYYIDDEDTYFLFFGLSEDVIAELCSDFEAYCRNVLGYRF